MKKSIVIGTIVILATCTFQAAQAGEGKVAANVWPEAVTFSKQQMSRLDIIDPSYEHRLENILVPNKNGQFADWKHKINSLSE